MIASLFLAKHPSQQPPKPLKKSDLYFSKELGIERTREGIKQLIREER